MIKHILAGVALALCGAATLSAEPTRSSPAPTGAMMGANGPCFVSTGDSLNFARLGVMRDTPIPSGGGGVSTGDGVTSPTLSQAQQDRNQDSLQNQIDAANANTSSNTASGDGPGKSTSSSSSGKSSGTIDGVKQVPCKRS